MQAPGASLVAISTEKPDNSLNLIEKHQLQIPVLSDVNGSVMKKYNLAWEMSNTLRELYIKHLNRDFNEINNGAGWVLPIPATIVIDRHGVIRESHVNEDYTKRMEPSQVLEILKQL
jgi:peroxiredoxin